MELTDKQAELRECLIQEIELLEMAKEAKSRYLRYVLDSTLDNFLSFEEWIYEDAGIITD